MGLFLPGGGIDPGETPEIALLREAIEETGHQVEILKKIGEAAQFWTSALDPQPFNKLCHYFAVRLLTRVADPVELDHEVVWLSADTAVTQLTEHAARWAVREVVG